MSDEHGPVPGVLPGWLGRYVSTLRYPQLFAITAGLFVVDLLVPDVIPLIDEILLGLATLALGAFRAERREVDTVEKDVTPRH